MSEPPGKKIKTRSSAEYFLVGCSATRISGSKLPTLRQTFQYLLYLKEEAPKTSPLSAHISTVVDQVLIFWSMAGIETITKRRAEARLKKEHDVWTGLCKSKKRTSDPEGKRESFANTLDKLWDIGSTDALMIIQRNRLLSPEEKDIDIAFYEDQRTERKCIMSGMDKVFQQNVQRKKRRIRQEWSDAHTSSEEVASLLSSHSTESSDVSSASQFTDFDEAGTSSTNDYVTSTAPKNLINNEEITLVLDRLKITDNAGTMLYITYIYTYFKNYLRASIESCVLLLIVIFLHFGFVAFLEFFSFIFSNIIHSSSTCLMF